MRLTYYIQTNLAAITLTVFTMYYLNTSTSKRETSAGIFFRMLWSIIAFCLADIAAVLLSGSVFPGSWWLSQIVNIIYFIVPVFMAYMWYVYIHIKLNKYKVYKNEVNRGAIPAIAMCLFIMTNPWTKYFFTVDEANLYHRGPGVMPHQLFCWAYFLIALSMVVIELRKEKNEFKKKEYKNYLLFIVPIAFGTITQLLFYGVTSTQLGFAFSVVLVLFTSQQTLIHKDELTGLNNRNSFTSFVDTISLNPKNDSYTVIMIDVDGFKSINDNYGHLLGDEALQHTARVLMRSAGAIDATRLHIYRYGGDEFVIIGKNIGSDIINELKANLKKELETENATINTGYKISLSLGICSGICNCTEDMKRILDIADKEMYQFKK